MKKTHVVELTPEERSVLEPLARKLKGSSQKVKQAHIPLKAIDGAGGSLGDAAVTSWLRAAQGDRCMKER